MKMCAKIEGILKAKKCVSHGLQVTITWKCCIELSVILRYFIVQIISAATCYSMFGVASLFLCCSRTCMFVHAFYIHLCALLHLSVFRWSVYLSCSPCTRTSSRHAYFLCTWMAISAALPITIIYIKFEINFTLFSLCNYVNSCCETKLHTWILIAVSFKNPLNFGEKNTTLRQYFCYKLARI